MKTERLKFQKVLLRIFISNLFFLSVITLHAQKPLVLSLDSAISYAINHNKTLINSKFTVDKSAQQIREAISQGLPQVNASLDYTNYLGASAELRMNPSAPPITISFNPTSNFKASVNQLVFSGNYFVGIKLAKLGKEISGQRYQKDELNVKEQTIQAYYMVLVSERILGLLKKNRKNAQLIYNNTNNLANAGMIEETDAKKLSVMVTSVDNALKSAERQVELSYNILRLQLGLDSNQAITLSSDIDDIVRQSINPLIETYRFNIQKNIDYQLVSMQGEIAKKQILMNKANFLPSLVAFYSYTKKIKKPNFDISPKNVVGLTLSIPIFSSGQRLAKLNQAKIDYSISENTKALLTQQLSMQEKQLLFNYKNLLSQFKNQQSNVEIAKEVLEKMKLKYQQGTVSILDLTSANNDYLNAESDYTNIMLKLLNAELALRKINNNL